MAVIDSYSETNQNNFASFDSSYVQVGQSFTGDGSVIDTAQFYLKKTGAPSYNMTAAVYAHSGTFGTSSITTGAALATSATVSTTSLTTSFALYTFTFTGVNQITLSNATKYVIVLNGSLTGFTDFVSFGFDDTSPSHGGNLWDDVNGARPTRDLIFYVNGTTTAGLAITTNAATNVAARTATGNGNITDVTSGNADERGIVYSTSTQSAPGNVAPGSSGYSGLVNETGSFSTGAFTESLTGLSPLTRYYARAYAHNSTDGYIYGSEVNFITGLEVAWFRA